MTAVVIGAVALERLAELHLSRRNSVWAIAHGAVEVGPRDYRVMVAFHALFLAACVAESFMLDRPFVPTLATACLVALAGAQALRWWAIAALGPRWNTRIIVFPDAAPVTGGPYRWLRHPNYVAVIAEMVALPLLHGAWITAVLASAGNAFILRARIAAEERALGPEWARVFAATPRFVPGGPRAGD
jgi:methyltransferase